MEDKKINLDELYEKYISVAKESQGKGIIWNSIPDELKDNMYFILDMIPYAKEALVNASERLQNDVAFISHALNYFNNNEGIQYLNEAMLDSQSVMLKACKIDPSNFLKASQRLQNNEQFLIDVYKLNKNCYQFFPTSIKGDKEFIRKANSSERVTGIELHLAFTSIKDKMHEMNAKAKLHNSTLQTNKLEIINQKDR